MKRQLTTSFILPFAFDAAVRVDVRPVGAKLSVACLAAGFFVVFAGAFLVDVELFDNKLKCTH
jgi:hypothetical protein